MLVSLVSFYHCDSRCTLCMFLLIKQAWKNIKEWRISFWWLVLGRNATFYAVLCSYTWTVHITLCAVELQWHKMYMKCPQHPSSSFLTTAAERNKLPTGCYFFACLVFSPHDMNVFVTDLTAHNVVTHMHGFSSGFWWSCLWNCEIGTILINVWLPCMVNV